MSSDRSFVSQIQLIRDRVFGTFHANLGGEIKADLLTRTLGLITRAFNHCMLLP